MLRRRQRVLVPALVCVAGAVTAPDAFAAKTVALWHLDETSGTTMFDAVGGHSGKLSNVTLNQPGFLGRSYLFSGKAQVIVPTKSDLNPGSANLTVTLRMKTTKKPSTPDWDLIRKGQYTTAGGEFKMEYQPSGQASCGFKGSKYAELVAGPALNDGRWHSVSCVKTATNIQVVVDGRAFAKSVVIGSISNSSSVVIGSYPNAEFYQGNLDEISYTIG